MTRFKPTDTLPARDDATGSIPDVSHDEHHRRWRPHKPRKGSVRPFVLALAMHLLLFAMLFIGVKWQSQPPVAVQAELWTPPPPRVEPPPQPEPEPPKPVPEPPKPRPEPKVEATPPKPEPVPDRKPDIAVEKQKERERQRADEARREAERREAEARKATEAKKAAEAKREADARKAAEAKRDAERKEAEARKAAEAKKVADARREQERREAEREAKAEEQRRQEHVRRMMSSAGGSEGGSSGAASPGAARGASSGGATGGVDGGYAGRVSSLIRSNTVFAIPSSMQGNPKAEFVVSILPDCSVTGVRLRRSSGVPAWDQAAERAIQRSSPMPRRSDGSCPRELVIEHAPRDER